MPQVARHAAAVRRSPRLFRFIRVRLSRKLWGTYRITLRNIISSTLGWMLVGIGLPAGAAPVGGQVVAGQAQISAPTAHLTLVNQASPKAVINWQSFDIAGNETVKIVQPSASSVLLNRIVGGDPSKIYGALTANGQVFLVNPQGVYFAPGARVDTGALVASTLALSDFDFSAGRYRFGGVGGVGGEGGVAASVVNDGRISVAPGGYVVLAAPQVSNTGTIRAAGGTVALLAGARVNIDTTGDGLISYSVDAGVLHASVTNAGSLLADGGAVSMTAHTVGTALATAVNQTGVIRANSVAEHHGVVTLRAIGGNTVVTGSIDVSAVPTAVAQTGGTVEVLGQHVELIGDASINASGAVGGGTVLIGGAAHGEGGVPTATQTTVGADVRITANAGGVTDTTHAGDGGTVIVWSDGRTVFSGAIDARGGATGGHGGLVETSGKGTLVFNGTVDTRAPQGQTGTLLLDPTDITISSNPSSASASTSNFNTTDLQSQLATNEVILNTEAPPGSGAGSIIVNDALSWASSNNLTLKATTTLALNAAVTNTGSGALTLSARDAVTLNANVMLAGGAFSVSGAGGVGTRAASFTAAPGASIRTRGGAVNIATVGALVTQAIDTSGAAVSAGAGLAAGAVTLDSSLGNVSAQGAITAVGSDAFAGSELGGGAGGSLAVTGSSGVHIASVTTTGGMGDGAGSPGAGGNVALVGGSGGVTQTAGSVIQTALLSASTSGAITLTEANQIDRLGAVTANGAITLNNAAVGGLTVGGAVTTNGNAPVSIANDGGFLTLVSGGSVTGSAVALTTTMASTTSAGPLVLGGPVDGNAGTVTLTSAQNLSQTSAGTIHTSGALLLNAEGRIQLGQANRVAELGASASHGAFTFNNTGGALTVTGAVTTHDNQLASVTNAGGDLTIGVGASVAGAGVALTTASAHDIVLLGNVDGSTSGVMLGSGGAVRESATGTINTTDTLTVNAAGPVRLDQANTFAMLGAVTVRAGAPQAAASDVVVNTVGGLTVGGAVVAPGAVSLSTSGGGMTVGTGGSVTGNGVALAVNSAHTLQLSGRVNGNDGDVTLMSGLDIRQAPAGTINTSGALVLNAGGAITLGAPNTLTSLGEVTRGGAFVLNNTGGDLTLTGSVSAGTTSNAVRIATAGGALVLGNQTITATTTAGTITLTGAGVSQTSGTLTAGGVTQVNAGTGSIDLQASSNDFSGAVTLSSSGASAAVRALGNLTLGAPTLGPNTGLVAMSGRTLTLPAAAISTGSGSIELHSDAGPLATNGALTTTSGAITLVGAQGLSVAHALTTASGAIALVGGGNGVGVTVNSAVRVDAGNAALSVDGGGAAMALNDSTLTTTNASAAALSLRNATSVALGNVSTGVAGTTALDVNGNVTQTTGTAIHTGTLTARTGGSLTLTQSNAIDSLGAVAVVGDFTLNVRSAALTLAGAVTTSQNGAVSLTNLGGDLIQTAAGTIHTGGTLVVTAGGVVQLDQANHVAALGAGASNGAFTFNNSGGDLHVTGAVSSAGNGVVRLTNSGGSLSVDSGASVAGGGVQLSTASAHDIVLAGPVDGGNGSVGFSAGADIHQSASGTIHTSNALSLIAAGSVRLDAANTVGSLGAVTVAGGDLTFNNLGALTVAGAVLAPGAVRITSAGGDLAVGSGNGASVTGTGVTLTTSAGHNIALGGLVNGNAGDVTLVSGQDISEAATGAINTSGALLLNAGGSITLAQANTIATLGSVTRGGAFSLNNVGGGLTLTGSVSGGATDNAVRITTAGGALVLGSHDITATTAAGNVTLVGDGVSQTGGTVTAGGMTTVNAGTGSIALMTPGNDFGGAVSLSSSGAGVAVRAANGLALAAVTLGANTALTAIAGGTLSLPMSPVHTGSGAIELRSDGGPLTTQGELATTSGAITLVGMQGLIVANSLSTASGPVALTGGGSGLTVNSGISVDAGNALITLNGGGASSAIVLNNSVLKTTNNSASAITVRNASSVALGNLTTGAAGTTTLGVGSDLSNGVSQTAGTAITTGTLTLSTAGAITLDQANAVAKLGTVTRGGAFTLNDAIGDLTLTGSVSGGATNNAVTLATTGGTLALGAFDVTATTAAGNVTLAGIDVSQTSGTVTAGGTTTVNAGTGSIALMTPGNDFGGAVSFSSSGAGVAVRAANGLALAALTLGANTALTAIAGGTLSLPAAAISTGSGAITLVGMQGLTVANSLSTASGPIALTGGGSGLTINSGISVDAGNAPIAINGGGASSAIVLNNSVLKTTNNSASAITVRNASSVALGNLTTGAAGTTTLGVGADIRGNVTQTADTGITTGTLLLSTAGAITLDQVNAVARLGVVRRGGAFSLNDAIGDLTLTGSVSAGATNNAVSLTTSGGALTLGAFDVTATGAAGNVTLGGVSVSQTSGTVTAGSTTTVTAGYGSIDLRSLTNDFTGAVTLNSLGASAALHASNNLTLAAPTLGTNTSLTAVADGTLSLPTAAIHTGNGAIVLRSDGGMLATQGALVTTGGAITLVGAQGLTVANALTTTGGLITLTGGGSGLSVNSGVFVDAGSEGIALNGGAGAIALNASLLKTTNNSAAAITVRNASTVVLGNVRTGAAGTTTLGVGADISGAVSQTAGTSISTGTLVLSTGAAITLDQANVVARLGAVTRGGAFSLNDTSGGLTLTGSISGGATNNAVTLTTAGGALALGAFNVMATTAAGKVTLAGVGVSQTNGRVTAGGTTTVNAGAGSIDLQAAANRFTGVVNTAGTNVALAAGGSALVLGTTTASGTLNVSSSGGAISEAGVAHVTGTATLAAQLTPGGAAADITLGAAGNRFAGVVNTQGANVTLVVGSGGNNGLQLGATTATGALNVTQLGGAILEAGAATVGGASTFVATAAPGGAAADITLGTTANRLGGIVSSSGANVTLAAASALVLGNTNATNLVVTDSGGSVTGTGMLMISGSTRVASTTNAVTLTNVGNDFAGIVTASAGTDLALVGSRNLTIALIAGGNASATALAGNLAVSGRSGAALTTASSGTTAFGAAGSSALSLNTSAGGDVSQAGALTVAGAASVTSTRGAITLANGGNAFGGSVSVTTTAPGKDITLVNQSDLSVALSAGGNAVLTALSGQLGVSGSTGAALATRSAGATSFGLNHIGTTLTTTAGGNVQQSAAVTVAGMSSVTSSAGSIALGNVGNDFGGVVTAMAATAGQGITLVDRSDLNAAVTAGASAHVTALAGRLEVSGSTGAGLTTVSGAATSFGATHVGTTLSASAGADLVQTGALTVGATAVLSSTGGAVMLTNAGNDFAQVVTAGAGQDLAIVDRSDLNVVLTADGNATVTAAGNVIVSGQTGAALSTVSGAATAFGATTVGTGLTTTAAGNVTQSGAVSVGGTAAITAPAGSVMLSNAGNRFGGEALFKAAELRFQTSQNAIVQIKGVTGNVSITTGGTDITLNGGYFNGPTLKLTSLSAPGNTGVVLRKEADRPYFQLGEGLSAVSTALASKQDLVAFFHGAYPTTLIDGVPYAALEQFRLLSGSAMAAELGEQERRERERSAGVGRLKEAIRLNAVTYDEIVAPLNYTSFEVLTAPCAKAQATGKTKCE